MSKQSHSKVLLLCLGWFFIFHANLMSAQNAEIKGYQKLKSELRSILQFHGIQPAASIDELTEDQIKTLNSITKVDDYPIYVMTYFGGMDLMIS